MGEQARRPRRRRTGPGRPHARRCHRCQTGPSSNGSPPTCRGCGHAPTTSNKDRKRLLRTLIADITLLPEPDRAKARIGIRWHTGATDDITVTRVVHPGTAKRSPSPAVAMVTRLGPTTPTAELADLLNAAGHTTGTGAPFDGKAVQWIRHAYHIPAPNPYADGEISVAEAAHRLGCSTGVKTRVVPLTEKTIDHLHVYLDEFHPNTAKLPATRPVFYSPHHGRPAELSADTVSAVLKQAAAVRAQSMPLDPAEHPLPHAAQNEGHGPLPARHPTADHHETSRPRKRLDNRPPSNAFSTIDMMRAAVDARHPNTPAHPADTQPSPKTHCKPSTACDEPLNR